MGEEDDTSGKRIIGEVGIITSDGVVGIAGKGEEIVGTSKILKGEWEEERKGIWVDTTSKDESLKVLPEVVTNDKGKTFSLKVTWLLI